ncbi:MAG: phage major capsid protein [Collinsella sp.]
MLRRAHPRTARRVPRPLPWLQERGHRRHRRRAHRDRADPRPEARQPVRQLRRHAARDPATGSVTYKQRSTQTGMPATWGGVVDGTSAAKAKVLYSYKDAVANKETLAGYVPVSEDTLKDYDELLSIIQHDLLLDLNSVTDDHMFSGNNPTGIVGIKNTTGILEFEEHVGGLYYEAIRKMRTKVMLTAKRVPTHVLVSPIIKQEIDLYKTETGLYQFITGDVLWGMKVVEDPNCDGLLVYDSYAAERRSIHGTTVDVDRINDQFIHNELCVRAEHTKALQVRYPTPSATPPRRTSTPPQRKGSHGDLHLTQARRARRPPGRLRGRSHVHRRGRATRPRHRGREGPEPQAEDLTVKEIKAKLDAEGIEYPKAAKKEELLALLEADLYDDEEE